MDYVRIANNLLIFMKCASPAVNALHTNEIFTRLMATEDSQHADLATEKSVKHMRAKVGKVELSGMVDSSPILCVGTRRWCDSARCTGELGFENFE